MADCKMLRCEIERQKKKTTSIDLYLNGGDTVKDDVQRWGNAPVGKLICQSGMRSCQSA